MRMNVRQWRLQSAGFYQVHESWTILYLSSCLHQGYDKAKVETEFVYKNCCKDETGESLVFVNFKDLKVCLLYKVN